MNPHAVAWVQRTKHEVLDHFFIFGEKHLRHLIFSWLDYYHRFRPRQGLGNALLTEASPSPKSVDTIATEDIVCHERLGGLLKHYQCKAA
jgi:hypothetical protein